MEMLGGNINGLVPGSANASQDLDSGGLLPDTSGMNQSLGSLPLNEKSYISDISDSVILTKTKDTNSVDKKSKVSSKNRGRKD